MLVGKAGFEPARAYFIFSISFDFASNFSAPFIASKAPVSENFKP